MPEANTDSLAVDGGGDAVIYLDNAAMTMPKPDTVQEAVLSAMREASSAGRSAHRPAMRAAEILFDARQLAAELFSVDDSRKVIFTKNATEALNIAIFSMAEHAHHFVITGIEHNAVVRPLRRLQQKGLQVTVLPTVLWDDARLLESTEEACKKGADCFVVCHVSNVFGWKLPVAEMNKILEQYHVPMILDASQSAGICPVSAAQLSSATAICMPGHKGLYGPQGTGILLALSDAISHPLLLGGTGSRSQETEMPEELPDRFEAGTHAIPAIAGLTAGMRFVKTVGIDSIGRHEHILCRQMADMLSDVPEIQCFVAPHEEQQTGVLSVVSDVMDAEDMAQRLGERDICVRAGLHCAPMAHRTAGTLSSGTVRLSPGWFQNTCQMKSTAKAIRKILKVQDRKKV